VRLMLFRKKLKNKDLFCEYIFASEETDTEKVGASVIKRMQSLYAGKRALRDTHVKTHACVKAHLEIIDFDADKIKAELANLTNLSNEQLQHINLKQGIFKEARAYPALLRFANGTIKTQSDQRLDARSMSVKLYDVEGEHFAGSYSLTEQDIIVQNATVFFVRGIKDYHSFFKAARGNGWRILPWLIMHPYQAYQLYKTIRRKPLSLLTERYWSGSAFSIGDSLTVSETKRTKRVHYPLVVKYGFFPTETHGAFARLKDHKRPSQVTKNYYREDITHRLSTTDALYYWDFAIQIQTNPKHAIDDVTVDWAEDEAPFYSVGRLVVKQQDIKADEQFEAGEKLRFSPWNGLKVHRPVGELNRLRRNIYPIVSNIRKNTTEPDEQ